MAKLENLFLFCSLIFRILTLYFLPLQSCISSSCFPNILSFLLLSFILLSLILVFPYFPPAALANRLFILLLYFISFSCLFSAHFRSNHSFRLLLPRLPTVSSAAFFIMSLHFPLSISSSSNSLKKRKLHETVGT